MERIILGKDQIYAPSKEFNNNVLIVGSSGSGKSYSFVQPNLLELEGESNAVVLDPKGSLYSYNRRYLESVGYTVKEIDFDLLKGDLSYDPLALAESEEDIMQITHALVFSNPDMKRPDPFFDRSAEQALIAVSLLSISLNESDYFSNMLDLAGEYSSNIKCLQTLFDMEEVKKKIPLACRMFDNINGLYTTERTWACVVGSLHAFLYTYYSKEFREFLKLKKFDFEDLINKKTVLFIKISDNSSLHYGYLSLFINQLFRYLFNLADKAVEKRLRRPVKFFLDDFCASLKIENFDKYISTGRSRGISFMLSIQSLSQLKHYYGDSGDTIVANCDNIVYLSNTCIETLEDLSKRVNLPLSEVLYMGKDEEWVLKRGQRPIHATRFDYKRDHPQYLRFHDIFTNGKGILFPRFETKGVV